MTVWVRNGRVIYPAGSTVRLAEYGDLFGDRARVTSGTLTGVDGAEALKTILCAIPLEDGAYYVHWVDEGDDASLFTAYSDEQAQLLSSVEIVHGGFFLDIVDQGQGLEFGYKSFFFDGYETPEALGITRQFLEDRPKTLEIGGEQYRCAFRAIREGEETGVYLAQFAATADQMQSQAILITALAGIILLAVTAWHLATQRLEKNDGIRASEARMRVEWQLDCARRLAGAIELDPALADGDTLSECNDAIGAMYLMLFDGDGNERACSARYTGFALGTDPEDSTTDFRLLLLGVPQLAHDPAVDERTGVNTRMVGVSCQMDDPKGLTARRGRFGALILAFEPDETDEAAEINSTIYSMTKPGWLTLVFDRESKTVLYSSEADIIGLGAEALGIPADSIRDSYMDAFYLMGERSYGFSSETGDRVYYYICNTRGLLRRTLRYACLVAAGFAAMYLILSVYLLLGRGDNIKIISNRDVRNVLNMSRMNSWIDMELTLSNPFPLHKIEEIMNRELPGMGRSIPDIISGPIYKGIVSMNGNRVTIAVTCRSKTDRLNTVRNGEVCMKSKAKRMLAIMLALLLAMPAMASAEGDDALVIPPELNEGLEGLDGPAGDLPTDALALEGIDLSVDLTVDGLLFEGTEAADNEAEVVPEAPEGEAATEAASLALYAELEG